ncbi:EamA family transporter [Vibrio viridaestus]|uniref:Uncharacterized protein n=1 Tax=Vibrio viridaestus TaxID=2487322 RepID=A0A3N9TD96_9VIBR|nr:EamA family transporter [Vibrio viridaestus]RQW62020.1 hypothetical protein EES38_16775 [Vibrio viridaestus]
MFGIIASFIGAFFQALNYFVTQVSQRGHNYSATQILIAIHICMAVILAFPLIFLGYWQYFSFSDYELLLRANIPYLLGQFLLFSAIRISDSSIVSPLLVLKIPAIALVSIFIFHSELSTIQWLSIAIIIYLAYSISSTSGKLDIKPALFVLGASICYGFSDIGITEYTKLYPQLSVTESTMVTVTINYFFCGVVMLIVAPMFKVPLSAAYHMKWSAVTWIVGVVLLVIGFKISGVLEANVIQSLRGVLGVLISFVALRIPLNKENGVWMTKFKLSLLMVGGVGLFYS